MTSTNVPPPRALIGWRLLALFYDLWPAAAVWMALGALFLLANRNQPLGAFSPGQIALWCVCWLVTGGYAILSWRGGGRTLGMRPWKLRLVGLDGARPSLPKLLKRYVAGTLSLLLGGIGFWWAWLDRDRLTWHDRISGTYLVRDA
ncbi:MAG: RDD family protein [Luteimonas sp.]